LLTTLLEINIFAPNFINPSIKIMKTFFLSISLFFLSLSLLVAQENNQANGVLGLKKIPAVELKTLDGKTINTADISNNGKPIIISFWATWCKPCVNELTTIADVYPDWQKETGVKLIAVSIDDMKTSGNVKTTVNGKNWDYEVLLDVNSEFKRAMNVNLVPHTFVINGNGEIVWQHTSFSQGSELTLIDIVRKVAKGEKVN
jgi:cytochrome c biogenesis protein CcmG, thiol:disulfide interchange protein DsbE